MAARGAADGARPERGQGIRGSFAAGLQVRSARTAPPERAGERSRGFVGGGSRARCGLFGRRPEGDRDHGGSRGGQASVRLPDRLRQAQRGDFRGHDVRIQPGHVVERGRRGDSRGDDGERGLSLKKNARLKKVQKYHSSPKQAGADPGADPAEIGHPGSHAEVRGNRGAGAGSAGRVLQGGNESGGGFDGGRYWRFCVRVPAALRITCAY